MKKIKFMSMLPITVVMACGIISCGDDGEDNDFQQNPVYNEPSSNEKIIISPSISGEKDGRDYVDLGLSVKWAVYNVDATSPEEYGGYYAFGETSTKNTYSTESYKFYNENYNSVIPYYSNIGFDIQGSIYDVATQKWGQKWRTPNQNDFIELKQKCTTKIVDYNGIKGMLFIAPNGNQLFLPSGGYKPYELPQKCGCYATSEIDIEGISYPTTVGVNFYEKGADYYPLRFVFLYEDNYIEKRRFDRQYGVNVRAVTN